MFSETQCILDNTECWCCLCE